MTPVSIARGWILSGALLFALTSVGASAQTAADADAWKFSGDLRAGYFASEREARDGQESDEEAFNARVRVAVQRGFAERWAVRVRAAGRFSSAQDGVRAYLRDHTSTGTGADWGDVTLDEAWLGYRASDEGMHVRVGRFQSQFALPGVPSKGLDRNDSPNTDINWTDGVHLDAPLAAGWRGHAILQHQSRHGSSSVARAPLDFSDPDSRATAFLGLRNSTRWGALSERMLSVTWMPDSLAPAGASAAARKDYMVVTARAGAEWPLAASGMRLLAGAELGYAPNTPSNSVVSTGRSGDSDGLAWQVAASVYDMAPGHHLGVVYGRAGAGWLLSPDYRPNEKSAEIRYQWRLNANTSFEARLRERKEMEIPAAAQRARSDHDLYARISYKF